MDTLFAHAVSKISELPLDTQRFIGEALLDGAAQPNLPVIDFTEAEHAMLDEADAEIARGEVIGQEEMAAQFDALRTKSYAAL